MAKKKSGDKPITVRAHVRDGELILIVPTSLPEGTDVDLVLDDEGYELTEDERVALHAALKRSVAEALAGRGRLGADVLRDRKAGPRGSAK